MKRDDFCAFILTHGRADNVVTVATLERCGYTGPLFIVIDNEDKQAERYRQNYGDKVIMFDKAAVAEQIDEGDNFGDRRAIIYARNACFDIAERLGYRYFIELDDDYVSFRYRFDDKIEWVPWDPGIKHLDAIWEAMLAYYESIDAASIAMAQGGDFIGGNPFGFSRRKAMNSFICSIDRRFKFSGRINEDVNTYVTMGSRGLLFLTIPTVDLNQKTTQSNSGGMTELYLDSGTYIKSFYTVMYSPSSVHVMMLQTTHHRLHHKINWRKAVPQIISEDHRKRRTASDA